MYLETPCSTANVKTNHTVEIIPSAPDHNTVDKLLSQALFEPIDIFSGGQGKQFRATMTRLAYQLVGGLGTPPAELLDAIEMLHAGSLVIDDIEDQTVQRRGQLAVHEQIGVPLAINMGNWMYFSALEKLSQCVFAEGQNQEVLPETVRTVRVCHEGQALDLAARVDEVSPAAFASITAGISERKTGELMGLAAWLGATAATTNADHKKAIRKFARSLGVVLQMLNDLGELARREPRLDDLYNRRVTWPWAWLTQTATNEFVEHLQCKLQQCERVTCYESVARQLVTKTQEYGMRMIQAQLKSAFDELVTHDFEPAALSEIRDLIARLEISYA